MKKLLQSFVVLLVAASFSTLSAGNQDLTQKGWQQMDFKGSLGFFMKLGGAEKKQYEAMYQSGDYRRMDKLDKKGKVETSMILNLKDSLIINIDWKKKKYTQMTFQEYREFIKQSIGALFQRPVPEEGEGEEGEGETVESEEPRPEVEWHFEFSANETGKSGKVAKHKTDEVVMTMKVSAKAKQMDEETGDMEEAGGYMKVESTNKIARNLDGKEQFEAFNRKAAAMMGVDVMAGGLAGVLQMIMEKNEQLAAAIARMAEEGQKMQGVILESKTRYSAYGETSKKPEEGETELKKPSVGSVFGGLGKKFGKKDKNKEKVILEARRKTEEYDTKTKHPREMFMPPGNFEREEVKLPGAER